MNPFLLLLLGWVLVLLEFYLPGMIMGITGGCMIVGSVILYAVNGGSPVEVFLFFVLALAGLAGVVKFALWQIRSTKKANSLYLNSDQTGYVASSFDKHLIGKKGVAVTDLKPGGYIGIEGKKYPAVSVSGYISKGDDVLVLSGEEDSFNVKKITKESSS